MKTMLDPYILLNSTSISSNTATDEFESIAYFGCAVQVNVSSASSLTCELTLEASNDNENWCTIEDSAQSVTSNTPHMWQMWEAVPFKWLRVRINVSAGSAIFKVLVTGMRA